MVHLDDRDLGIKSVIKPQQTPLAHIWIAAAWNTAFTEFMREFVAQYELTLMHEKEEVPHSKPAELYMGDVIQAAVVAKLNTTVLKFDAGCYLDIDTPEDIVAMPEFFGEAQSDPVGIDLFV